jgi:hypothetical protein
MRRVKLCAKQRRNPRAAKNNRLVEAVLRFGNEAGTRNLRGLLLDFGRRVFPFQVRRAAFPFFDFVVLSAHKNRLFTFMPHCGLVVTMLINSARFNTYLCLMLGLLLAGGGCQSGGGHKKDALDKKDDKLATLIELHIEVDPDGVNDNGPVIIGETGTFEVNVNKAPFLDGTDLTEAKVVDHSDGSFAIQLKFNWHGSLVLQTYTSSYINKRIAVYCVFNKKRWLAAPLVHKGISDGTFTFTPDATREEADRIVKGLNNFAAEVKKKDKM